MNLRHNPSIHTRKALPAHARPSRPTAFRKGSSYSGNATGRTKNTETMHHHEEEDDMASFLQFWYGLDDGSLTATFADSDGNSTTCERQMADQEGSGLYCSESCRKKDISQSAPSTIPLSPLMTSSKPSYFEVGGADILSPRSPTILRPVSLTFSDISADESDLPSDVDSDIPIPALSPPTIVQVSSTKLPVRPLPSRLNKSYSTHSMNTIELVAPCTTTLPSSPERASGRARSVSSTKTVTASDVAGSYAKRRPSGQDSEAQGSLKQLFRHDAIQAPPTNARRVAPDIGVRV